MKDAGSALKCLIEAPALTQIADRDLGCTKGFRKAAMCFVADQGTNSCTAPRQFRNNEARETTAGSSGPAFRAVAK